MEIRNEFVFQKFEIEKLIFLIDNSLVYLHGVLECIDNKFLANEIREAHTFLCDALDILDGGK